MECTNQDASQRHLVCEKTSLRRSTLRRVCYSQGPNKPGWEEMLSGDSGNGHYANFGTDTIVKDEIFIHDVWKANYTKAYFSKLNPRKVDSAV